MSQAMNTALENAQAMIAKLMADNANLTAKATALAKKAIRAISFRIGAKGGLSVYGLGRFPVTLYKEQWIRLLDQADEIRAFIAAHDSELKTKGDDEAAAA